ncbi:hypothetical protein SAMN02910409_0908 [Prevotellaceae bacterium HUN156]|nr:hypothetical protein SAMN02910409_0908 [Prevotellaceae bacterium HUN156]
MKREKEPAGSKILAGFFICIITIVIFILCNTMQQSVNFL